MIIKKNIPSLVNIDGETTFVSYNGQNQTCRHCNESAHSGISCIQNKKLQVQKLQADQLLYSNVTKQSTDRKQNNSKISAPKTHDTQPTTSKGQKPPKQGSSTIRNIETTKSTERQMHQKEAQTLMPPPSSDQTNEIKRTSSAPPLTTKTSEQGSEENQNYNDDQETDDSSTSNNSGKRPRGRPPGKKMRHESESNTNYIKN